MNNYKDRLIAAMSTFVTVSQLADALGVSYQAVKKVTDGKSAAFTAENNSKAAAFLGVSSDWLATGSGQARPVVIDLKTERDSLTVEAVHHAVAFDALTPDQRTTWQAVLFAVVAGHTSKAQPIAQTPTVEVDVIEYSLVSKASLRKPVLVVTTQPPNMPLKQTHSRLTHIGVLPTDKKVKNASHKDRRIQK